MAKVNRRAAMSLLAALAVDPAFASGYPERPVKLVVGYGAGGTMDTLARMYAAELGAVFGQPFIVENRTGAGGTLASQLVAQAPSDGYTLHMTASATQALTPLVSRGLRYSVERDFTQLATVAQVPLVLVTSADHPANSLAEFISWLKFAKNPSYGSSGSGQSLHLAGLMLQEASGIELIHVPFKGEAPALAELMGGRLSGVFATRSGAIPLIQAKKIKALAVADAVRSPQLPDVPTTGQAGIVGLEVTANYMFVLRSGTPAEITQRLEDEILKIAKDPRTSERLAGLGLTGLALGSSRSAEMLKREAERFRPLVSKYKITVD